MKKFINWIKNIIPVKKRIYKIDCNKLNKIQAIELVEYFQKLLEGVTNETIRS